MNASTGLRITFDGVSLPWLFFPLFIKPRHGGPSSLISVSVSCSRLAARCNIFIYFVYFRLVTSSCLILCTCHVSRLWTVNSQQVTVTPCIRECQFFNKHFEAKVSYLLLQKYCYLCKHFIEFLLDLHYCRRRSYQLEGLINGNVRFLCFCLFREEWLKKSASMIVFYVKLAYLLF